MAKNTSWLSAMGFLPKKLTSSVPIYPPVYVFNQKSGFNVNGSWQLVIWKFDDSKETEETERSGRLFANFWSPLEEGKYSTGRKHFFTGDFDFASLRRISTS